MQAVQQLLQNQQYDQLASLLDKAELAQSPDMLPDWPYALHLLSHIYSRQLEDARFLWKRIPPATKHESAELAAVWRLLHAAWNKDYPAVWQALLGFQWTPQLQPLVHALAQRYRNDLLALLSSAYSTIAPASVGHVCGLSEQDALALCQEHGWQRDPASGMLLVEAQRAANGARAGSSQMQQLTEYLLALEQA